MLYDQLANKFTEFLNKFEKIAHNEVNGRTVTSARPRRADLLRGVQGSDSQRRERDTYERYPSSSGVGFGMALAPGVTKVKDYVQFHY